MTRGVRLVWRSVIVIVATAAFTVVAFNGISTRWVDSDPVLAARLSPNNAAFAIAAATRLAGQNAGTRDPRVRRLVATALSLSVSDPSAITLRALEAGTDGDARREARLFALSNTISRRNLPTRLWLIQDSVRRGDVLAALDNFDLALRTSTDAAAMLFPVLTSASGDPQLTPALAHLLDRAHDWRAPFFQYVTTRADSAAGLAHVTTRMRDTASLASTGADAALIVRLVADQEFGAARQINDLFHHDRDAGASLRDGHFADAHATFPFGWLLIQRGEIGATRSLIDGHSALSYQGLSGGDGVVANQLLTLPPGLYRLKVRAAVTATDPRSPPYWTLTCAGARNDQIALLDAPMLRGATTAKSVSVPVGCTAQWLVFALRSSDAPDGQSGALAGVELSRI
jgi:hypothetical protein